MNRGTGEKAILPKVSAAAIGPVAGERVLRMSVPQGAREGVFAFGNSHKMDVIGHEAIADDAYAGTRGVVAQEVQVEAAIVVGEEDWLAVVAALSNVMGNSREDGAGRRGIIVECLSDGKILTKMRPSPFRHWVDTGSQRQFTFTYRTGFDAYSSATVAFNVVGPLAPSSPLRWDRRPQRSTQIIITRRACSFWG